jgi:hypothetical protein
MRASTAFFVGVGTVGLAITGGLGGGFLVGNMMSPPPPKHAAEAAPLDRPAAAAQLMPASGALPYAAATLAFIDPSIDGSAPAANAHADNSGASPPTQSTTVAASDQAAKPADHADARQQTQDPQQAAGAEPASAPQDAYAKAGDSDVKHAAPKGRAERAQRWAHRHRHERDRNTDRQARDDGDGSYYSYNYSDRRTPRYYTDQAPRFGFPRMFGPDD